jgi:hypothetical protein
MDGVQLSSFVDRERKIKMLPPQLTLTKAQPQVVQY